MIFAQVAVPVPARAGALFTYAVPAGMGAQPGSLVVVPFSSRILPGILVETLATVPPHPVKELLALVEDGPSLSRERVSLAAWIAARYRSSLFDALNLFLPPGWQRAVSQRTAPAGVGGRWTFTWPPSSFSGDVAVAIAFSGALAGTPAGVSRTLPVSRRSVRGAVISLLEARGPMPASLVAAEAGCALATVGQMVAEGWLE